MPLNATTDTAGLPVSQWLALLDTPGALSGLQAAYGSDDSLIAERIPLYRLTLTSFLKRFGDLRVRVFRAPGRVNLRGMHVDTHGGYLNLMTHQREVVLVAAPSGDGTSVAANVDRAYGEVAFDVQEEGGKVFPAHWNEFIAQPDVCRRSGHRRGDRRQSWANYIVGAALRVAFSYPEQEQGGLLIMTHSDLPSGAALSSSAALSVAALQAYSACNGMAMDAESLIRAEQDVEWYAGARVGMSDQTAILLGRPGQLLHLSVFAEDFSLDSARYLDFPGEVTLLVVNSHTTRALSGAGRVQYSLNRFAYSMALTVLRAELMDAGWAADVVRQFDRLSRLTPDALGGVEAAYRLLASVPEHLSLDALRKRYAPDNLDAAYSRYFDGVPDADKPDIIPLRGPLLFGMAESERARLFPEALRNRDFTRLGRLMSVGHDGDRVCAADSAPFPGGAHLEKAIQAGTPLEDCPGTYGASSPALDMLVDAALAGGALGACLTGAGIAGAILALCHNTDTKGVTQSIERSLTSDHYARAANLKEPLSPEAAATSIVVNRSVAGAGELSFAPKTTGLS